MSAPRVRFARYPGESGKIIFAPLLLALERGYFRDEGLDVEVFEPSDHPWQSVAREESHAGVGYIDYCARPEYRERFKAVAVQERLTEGRGLPAILARPHLLDDGTLHDEASLRGRTLGLTWGRGDDYLTYFFILRRGGLTFDDVRYVPVPHEGAARDAALARGEIDVIMNRRPRAAAQEEARGVLRRWKAGGEIERAWQNRFIIFGTEFMRRSPEVGRAFLRAHQRGAAAYIAGTSTGVPDAAFLPELAALSSETPELLTHSLPGGFPADCRIDEASLARDLELMKEAKLFPPELGVRDVIDQSFVPAGAIA
jgi:ABC-type nitrate/sulfonate/bicarbonate transport system substrate-binding protein